MKNVLKTNLLTTIGWILTILWLVFVGVLLGTHDFPENLNSIGDFVAGMASPLAFLWVVIGYYQSQKSLQLQAQELVVSNKALNAQVEELKSSVEQQKELVRLTNVEFEFSVEQISTQKQKEVVLRQPFIHLDSANIYRGVNKTFDPDINLWELPDSEFDLLVVDLALINSRSIARDVRVGVSTTSKGVFYIKTLSVFKLNFKESFGFNLDYPDIFASSDKVELEISFFYLDELDNQMEQRYTFEIKRVPNNGDYEFSRSFYLRTKSY